MSTLAKHTRATVIPCLRYRNAPAAIDWLCSAFGFEKQAVYPNADGTIAHAQLTFGNGMIMLGSARCKATASGATSSSSPTKSAAQRRKAHT